MNSTNIKVMSEEIQHLKNEVHNLDVEIPDHPATDAGKYLGVAADGSLAWSKVPDELPPTTGASAGQILALDNNKAPEWVDNYNLNYSVNEQDTGMKWIDGESVYMRVLSGTLPEVTASGAFTIAENMNINLLYASGVVLLDGFQLAIPYFNSSNTCGLRIRNADKILQAYLSSTAFSERPYRFIIYYTKPTPSALTSSDPTREAEPEIIEEPETETKSTRTKKSTK